MRKIPLGKPIYLNNFRLFQPAAYPGGDDYNTANTKDFDYATKKYFDSLRSNRHYRD